jgi:transcription elongation factor Elf1
MSQQPMRACRIEQVGKQRNGTSRFWCSVHKASATGPHGIRLDQCELAYRSAKITDIFDADLEAWPGGIAMWGAVDAVFDTTSLTPEVGVHVHARKVAGPQKDEDRTYEAVRIKRDKRNLFDDAEILITSETAVNYYLSRFMNREIRHLFCIRCGEPHLDAGYYAIKPHKNHLCHGCGHLFQDSAKSVSNPIMLLREKIKLPNHQIVRAPKSLDIRQDDFPGGIQIWASNPAFIWTSEQREEEGLHVHAFDADGSELQNDTFSKVTIDGITLNEEHIRYYMAQSVLPYLKGRMQSINCPQCGTPHFASGYDALQPRSTHICQSCGHSYKTPGRKRLVVTNPFVAVKDQLLSGKSVSIRRNK